MADIKSPEERSRNMARIRSKNTKPEEFIRKGLYHIGFRYRINAGNVIGHPDIWLGKYNTAIFVNGCFWHRHSNCKYAYSPKSNTEFWESKFMKNMDRDQFVRQRLLMDGIKVLVIWECTVKKMMKKENEKSRLFALISEFIHSPNPYMEI